jgi:hypothetical protein
LFLVLLFQRRAIQVDPASAASEAPEANDGQDGDDAEIFREESGSTSSPPPAFSKEPSLDKKRKCLDELLSSSTSALKDAPGETSSAKAPVIEIFDVLDDAARCVDVNHRPVGNPKRKV